MVSATPLFTLEQAQSFVAVAEELHFGRAAARLNMTQPPLSRRIQKLEEHLGARLLLRDNRSVALTAAGRAFLVDARRLLAAAERAPEAVQLIASGKVGVVRIGFTATAAYSLLGRLLTLLAERLPDVKVELEELVTGEQVDALLRGDIDLGLGRPPFDTGRLASALLSAEALLLAVPAEHPLASLGRAATAADLADAPLILHDPGKARYFHELVTRLLPLPGRTAAYTVSQVLTMLALVAAGRGVAFVPASARELGFRGVAFLDLAGEPANPVELHAVWDPHSANPALHGVLEVVATIPSGNGVATE